MKIGVLSDTHLTKVTDDLKRIVDTYFQDVDLILHAGDLVAGPVLSYLENLGAVAVRGNMDQFEVTQALPLKRTLTANGFRFGLIHGFGAPRGLAEALRVEFDQIDCLIFGHSHEPMNRRVGPELWFNPGAVSHPKGPNRTVGLLTLDREIEGRIITIN